MLEWAQGSLVALTALFGVAVAFVTGATLFWKKVVKPLKAKAERGLDMADAGLKVILAQMTPNGGGSLVDKVNATAVRVAKIDTKQDENRALQDDRHRENTIRFDEMNEEMVRMRQEMADVTVHQEYMMRLFNGLPTALTIDGQAAWRLVLAKAEEDRQDSQGAEP